MSSSNDEIGNAGRWRLLNAIRWLRAPRELIAAARSRFGHSFYLPLPGVGELLLTGDPGTIRGVIGSREFIGGRGIQALRPVLGKDSLIVTEGEQHRRQRGLLLPYFKSPYIDQFDEYSLDTCTQVFGELDLYETHSMIDILRRITLKIIVRMVFGRLDARDCAQIEALVNDFVTSFNHPAVLYLRKLQTDFGRGSPWGRFRRNRERLTRFIERQIERHCAAKDDDGSIVSQLVRHTGSEALDDQAIVSEIISLLLFGSDTSAATMAWFVVEIGKNSEVKRSISEELACAGIAQADTPLLDAAIKESMRLNPVVIHLSRICPHATEINGRHYAAETHAAPCMYLSHRDETVYENPQVYDPGRFLAAKPPGYSYYPFGLGDRRCLGEQLALRQMRLLMSTFLSRYDFSLVDGESVQARRHLIILVPSGGPRVRLLRRG